VTRIIAGAAKGRRLAVPADGTRPTAERVREALFSSLGAARGSWVGARVLDLYAGSGALGLEALSRGAAAALLVERDRRALTVLRRNVAAVGLPGAEVHPAGVPALVATPPAAPFDVVLIDPPYDLASAAVTTLLTDLAEHGWLADGATVVVERDRRGGFEWPAGYRGGRDRRYGDTVLAQALWYRRAPDQP
jgi:16S rRNA (guanine966-N2)-methyltransferase